MGRHPLWCCWFQHPRAVRFAVEVVDMAVEFGFTPLSLRYLTIWRVKAARINVCAFGGVVGGDVDWFHHGH